MTFTKSPRLKDVITKQIIQNYKTRKHKEVSQDRN